MGTTPSSSTCIGSCGRSVQISNNVISIRQLRWLIPNSLFHICFSYFGNSGFSIKSTSSRCCWRGLCSSCLALCFAATSGENILHDLHGFAAKPTPSLKPPSEFAAGVSAKTIDNAPYMSVGAPFTKNFNARRWKVINGGNEIPKQRCDAMPLHMNGFCNA